jgi:hypothetical protein
MKLRRDVLVAVLVTFCITSVLFAVKPIGSQTTFQYDPWADLNDDGIIDIFDLVNLANKYGTTGDPVNKTALLYNVNATLTELLSRIDQLNATLTELQSKVSKLETLLPPKKIRILPIDLSPIDNGQQYDKIPSGMLGGGTFYASIMLPNGAIVKNMSAVVYDGLSGSYQIKMELVRMQKAPPKVPYSVNTLASIIFSDPGAPGVLVKFDDTIDYPIIDNENYAYYIEVWFEVYNTNYELRWIEIEYEYP